MQVVPIHVARRFQNWDLSQAPEAKALSLRGPRLERGLPKAKPP